MVAQGSIKVVSIDFFVFCGVTLQVDYVHLLKGGQVKNLRNVYNVPNKKGQCQFPK